VLAPQACSAGAGRNREQGHRSAGRTSHARVLWRDEGDQGPWHRGAGWRTVVL